ncbi:MAG: type II toxin-antitoxin system RelE/ParE family toxin [Acidobacteria bacterium]|nr:type II toxin-antitoxin system RelE/ParE family toxin [Acidobacteriota bacterium]
MIIHPDAEAELNAAIDYYEECKDGLGINFLSEVQEAFRKILQNPLAWSVVRNNFRRCLVNRFPFAVIYVVVNDEIFIIAIAHAHRKPFYWKSRLE